MLVWVRLKQVAYQTDQTIYQVKHSLFSEYLRHQLKSPRYSDETCVSPKYQTEMSIEDIIQMYQ